MSELVKTNKFVSKNKGKTDQNKNPITKSKSKEAIPIITTYSRHEAYEKSVDHSEADPDFDLQKFRKHAKKAYKKYLKYDKNKDKPVEKYTGEPEENCCKIFFRKLCCWCLSPKGTSRIYIENQQYQSRRKDGADEISVIEGIGGGSSPISSLSSSPSPPPSSRNKNRIRVKPTYEATNITKKHQK